MATSKDTKKQYCDLLTPVVCDECDGQNDVINYCLQCNANICNTCKDTHCNMRLHRDHIVLSRTHPEVVKARRSKKVYCPHHTGKEYVTYCTRCKQPCCATCITEVHDGHKFCDLEKMLSQTESEVNGLVHDLEQNVIPKFEKTISQLEGEMASYEEAVDDVKRQSKERLQQVMQQLMKAHEILLTEVDKRGRKDMKIIERKKQELKGNLEEVRAAVEKAKSAPVDASLFLIFDELSKVCSHEPSKISCPGKPSFTESKLELSPVHDVIGNTNYDPGNVLLNTSTSDQHRAIKGTNFDPLTLELRVLKSLNGINAKYIVYFPKEGIWIYNGSTNSIDVYSEHFTRTKQITVDFSCHCMSLYGRNEILTMDIDNDRILRISRSGTITLLCNSDKYCYDIYVNNKQQIVVGAVDEDDCSTEMSGYKLKVYSPDATSVLQEMKKVNVFGGYSITEIRQTVSGDYVVAIDERVICFNKDLQNKWTYEFETEHRVGTITSLYCDKYNNIIVGDSYKKEIVMLSIDGQRVRTLLTEKDGICEPLSMDVDGKGRLWIGQENNVLIASYLK